MCDENFEVVISNKCKTLVTVLPKLQYCRATSSCCCRWAVGAVVVVVVGQGMW